MAAEVSAADGALRQGAKAVAQSRADLQNELKSLEGKLASIGQQWQGQGASAFSSLMARWREDANKIISALNEFEANLTASDSTYVASDSAQQSAMSRLQGRLG